MRTEYIVTEGDRLILYPDTCKAIRRLNLRFLCVMLPILVFMWVSFTWLVHFIHRMIPGGPLGRPVPHALQAELAFMSLMPWLMTVFYLAIYLFVYAALRRQRKPIITLSSKGVVIHTLGTQVGQIEWQEIAEVRVYTFLYRFVGIVPHDLRGLCKRLGGRAWLLRMNGWCIPLYQFFGIFVAPINIPQEYLPITADDLAARIVSYRQMPPSQPQAGVWPPPPAVEGVGP